MKCESCGIRRVSFGGAVQEVFRRALSDSEGGPGMMAPKLNGPTIFSVPPTHTRTHRMRCSQASYALGEISDGLISLRPPQKTLVYDTGMPTLAR